MRTSGRIPPLERPRLGTETGSVTDTRAERKLGGKAEAMPHKFMLSWEIMKG